MRYALPPRRGLLTYISRYLLPVFLFSSTYSDRLYQYTYALIAIKRTYLVECMLVTYLGTSKLVGNKKFNT